MSVIKDIVREYEITTDQPEQFGGSPANFERYKGSGLPERIGGGSEHPSEEPVTQEILDGREVHASTEISFQQMIMELDGSDTLVTTLQSAASDNKHAWILRNGLASNAKKEIVGGELGLTLSIGKVRQGSEGHRILQVNFSGAGLGTGNVIQPFTGGGS